jgi:replicative DNA helicase
VTSEVLVPQNLAAEQSVLGALLYAGGLGADQARDVLGRVRAEGLEATDFYWVERHGGLFGLLADVVDRGDPPDAVVVVEELNRRGQLERVGGDQAIRELIALASTSRNAEHHARIVIECARRREELKTGVMLTKAARNGGLDMNSGLREQIELILRPLPNAEAQQRLIAGDEFVLDMPIELPVVWGGASGTVAWAQGEPTMICGPDGTGKTTLAQQIALARAGLRERVLGMRVAADGRPVLYLALDRPAQAARSLARMVTEEDRPALRERLLVWRGPLPFDVAKTPHALADFAESNGAGTVVIDSLKDLAHKLSDDEVGSAVNSAMQELVARGIETLPLHHPRKPQQNSGPPNKLADIYGSRWIVAGMGSIFMLTGDAGDPIVKLTHLKPPFDPLPPYKLQHDHDRGHTKIIERVDLLELARLSGETGLTVIDAAVALYDTEKPNASEIEKARRQLGKLVVGGFLEKRGERPNPVSYHAKEGP